MPAASPRTNRSASVACGRPFHPRGFAVAAALGAFAVCLSGGAGCLGSRGSPGDLILADQEYYQRAAARVRTDPASELPDAEFPLTAEPRRVGQPRDDQYRDVTLHEVLHIAMAGSAVLREDSQFLSPGNVLLTNPEAVPSAFDPTIQETGGLYGGRGVEAALADFDPWFTSGLVAGRNELIQNNLFLSGGLVPGTVLSEESGLFSSRLEKRFGYGGGVALIHDWNYSLNNQPNRFYPSVYSGLARAEFRQPLWAGFGSEFTEIAGPISRFPTAEQPVNRGVVIARINNRISVLAFEYQIQNLVRDVQALYWELALAYEVYENQALARDSAEQLWKKVQGRADAGLRGTGSADEALAREHYYQQYALAENALSNVYELEARLRRLMGLPVNDGEILRPADEPVRTLLAPNWQISMAEALTRRVELRRQKSGIQKLALELRAARSLTKPRLDFASGYQLNGFGDQLFGERDGAGLESGYKSLIDGDEAGWDVGVEFVMPVGFRAARNQVRNLELRLAKARAVLTAQEFEITHELANAFQRLNRWYVNMQANAQRLDAAEQRLNAVEADYFAGRTTLDLLLRSQVSLAQARVEHYQSLVEYNKAIAEVYYREGTLLDHIQVRLAEGTWDPQIYAEALQRNWQRVQNGEIASAPDLKPGPAREIQPASLESGPEPRSTSHSPKPETSFSPVARDDAPDPTFATPDSAP